MSDWEVKIGDDFLGGGIRLIWARDAQGGREYHNGTTRWLIRGDDAVEPDVHPLSIRDGQARALLAALLRHYNGADDARMLRKDYDAERARVDKLIDLATRPPLILPTP